MIPSTFLLAILEPGAKVPEDEFNDWYDNEHIPSFVDTPAFVNGTRWTAVDGSKPTWATTYDVGPYDETLGPPWGDVAEKSSEREKRILAESELSEVRTYEPYEGNDRLPKPSALYNPERPAPFLQLASAEVTPEGEEEFHRWYDEEHIPKIATIPGWIRSRRFRMKSWIRMGERSDDQTPVMKWLAVHEYTNIDWLNNPTEDAKFVNEWTKKVTGEIMTRRELRVYGFRKHWKKQ
jgi:hypothetical protein